MHKWKKKINNSLAADKDLGEVLLLCLWAYKTRITWEKDDWEAVLDQSNQDVLKVDSHQDSHGCEKVWELVALWVKQEQWEEKA